MWQQGSTWTHSLLILRTRPNDLGETRLAFVVSKKIGKAVRRNRIKDGTCPHCKTVVPGVWS